MSVTVCLTYKRDWDAPIESLWAIARKKKAMTGMPGGRALRDDEQRNPFPEWMCKVFKRRGYEYDWFNTRFLKRIEAPNEDMMTKRCEDERLWLQLLLEIVSCTSWRHRFWLILSLQPTSVFTLLFPDKEMSPLPAQIMQGAKVPPFKLPEGVTCKRRDGKEARPTGKKPQQIQEPPDPPREWWQYDHGDDGKWNHNPANGAVVWEGHIESPQDLVCEAWQELPVPPKPPVVMAMLKQAQLARVTPVFIDGLEYEHPEAEDTKMEKESF